MKGPQKTRGKQKGDGIKRIRSSTTMFPIKNGALSISVGRGAEKVETPRQSENASSGSTTEISKSTMMPKKP